MLVSGKTSWLAVILSCQLRVVLAGLPVHYILSPRLSNASATRSNPPASIEITTTSIQSSSASTSITLASISNNIPRSSSIPGLTGSNSLLIGSRTLLTGSLPTSIANDVPGSIGNPPAFPDNSTSAFKGNLTPWTGGADCGKCGIEAPGGVTLVFWEPDDAGPAFNVSTPTNQVYTSVSDGFTLTSPSVYVIYSALRATVTCGESSLRTIGPSYDQKTIGYSSKFLAYGTLSSPDQRCDANVVVDGFHTIDFTSLYYTPIITSTTQKAGCPPYVNPRISLPAELTDVDPSWKSCEPLFYGAFDPPRAIHKAGALAPPPTEPGPVTTAIPDKAPPSSPVPPADSPAVPAPTHNTPPAANDPAPINAPAPTKDPAPVNVSAPANDPPYKAPISQKAPSTQNAPPAQGFPAAAIDSPAQKAPSAQNAPLAQNGQPDANAPSEQNAPPPDQPRPPTGDPTTPTINPPITENDLTAQVSAPVEHAPSAAQASRVAGNAVPEAPVEVDRPSEQASAPALDDTVFHYPIPQPNNLPSHKNAKPQNISHTNPPPQYDNGLHRQSAPQAQTRPKSQQNAALPELTSPPSTNEQSPPGQDSSSGSGVATLPIFDPRPVDSVQPAIPKANPASPFESSPAAPADGTAHNAALGQHAAAAPNAIDPHNPASPGNVATPGQSVPGNAAKPQNSDVALKDELPQKDTPNNPAAASPNGMSLPGPIFPNVATPYDPATPGNAASPQNAGAALKNGISENDMPNHSASVSLNTIGPPNSISPSNAANPFYPATLGSADNPQDADGVVKDMTPPKEATPFSGAASLDGVATPYVATAPYGVTPPEGAAGPDADITAPVVAGAGIRATVLPTTASNRKPAPTFMAPTPGASHVAVLQVNGHGAERMANGALRIGGQTVTPGQETNIYGVAVSVGSKKIALDGTSYTIAPNPTSTIEPLATFSPPLNGQAFTIPVPSGDGVNVASLSAALPGASLQVLPGGDSIMVHGFDGGSLQDPQTDIARQSAISSAEEGNLGAAIVGAFTQTEAPLAGETFVDDGAVQKFRATITGVFTRTEEASSEETSVDGSPVLIVVPDTPDRQNHSNTTSTRLPSTLSGSVADGQARRASSLPNQSLAAIESFKADSTLGSVPSSSLSENNKPQSSRFMESSGSQGYEHGATWLLLNLLLWYIIILT
ncbi:MAG: hypothetical protein Q9217_006535 [Psora testacea]